MVHLNLRSLFKKVAKIGIFINAENDYIYGILVFLMMLIETIFLYMSVLK